MEKQTAKMDNWAITVADFDPYTAPELQSSRMCLSGDVSDHPNEDLNGKFVTTSPLIAISGADMVAESQNTKYSLGEPHPDFANWMKQNNYTLEQYEEKLVPEPENERTSGINPA